MTKPVLLIRADHNDADAQALSHLGIETLIDPYTQVVVAQENPSGGELLATLEHASAPLWLIATSLNALSFLAKVVGEDELRAAIARRKDLQFAAVGSATAKALQDYGAREVFLPQISTGQSLGEELVSHFGVGHALIPGGNLAMKTLPETLLSGGWKVSTALVYETSIVEIEPESVQVIRDGGVSAILLRSPSALRALLHFLPVPEVALVCAGSTTAKAVEGEGLFVAALSPNPSPEVVASTIHSLIFQER